MTKRELEQRLHMLRALEANGISLENANKLRRISMCLRSWYELECGMGDGQISRSIERETDEPDSKPFLRVQYPTANGYVDECFPVRDREQGALKRLKKIMAKYPKLSAYVQGDPRGAALYILRPGDVPKGERADGFYTRGICVF